MKTPFEILTDLATVTEALTRADVAARTRDQRDQLTPIGRMAADVPGVKAAAYDAEHGGTSHWCDEHEVEVETCHRRGRTGCKGVPLSGPSDPTGEAVVATTPGMISLRVLETQLDVIAGCVADIFGELRAWALIPVDAAKALTDGQDAEANARGERVCWCCFRAGGKPPTHTPKGEKPTNVTGILEEFYDLCAWCQRFVRTTGTMPSLMVSEAHVQGMKLQPRDRGDVIEVRSTAGLLVDKFPKPTKVDQADVA